MVREFNYLFWLLAILFIPAMSFAASPTWEIIPNESKITFTGTQNNSPISGEFKKFSGKIHGDIDQLEKSNVELTIDINSLSTSFKDIEDTLKAADWFNIKAFPTAVFTANHFKKIADKHYQATGKLTIRDKTIPLDVAFVVDDYTKTRARISGSVLLKRTAFDVGAGEWGSTDDVKDEVKVNFTLTATKKSA